MCLSSYLGQPLRPGHDGRLLCEDVAEDGEEVGDGGLVPEAGPGGEIGVVYATLGVYVLARADHHGVVRGDVDEGRLARIGVRDPDGNGEAVSGAAEEDRDGAREVEEEGRDAIVKGVGVGARGEGGIGCEDVGDVIVGAVDVVIFLRGVGRQEQC